MNPTLEKLMQPTFLLTLVAALKLILQPFGIQLSDAEMNMAVNVICGFATLVGLWIDHGKKPASQQKPALFTAPAVIEEQAPTQFPDKP